MQDPVLVAECVAAMKNATALPVTVKHRTGIDQQEDYEVFAEFVRVQIEAGADALIVHARNAWLKGLNPKQNREIPPLKYDWIYRLKEDFNSTEIVINGGIKTLDACVEHLQRVDGVMLGREPYHNPFMLRDVDQVIFAQVATEKPNRLAMLHRVYPYIENQLSRGMPLTTMVKYLIGLFHGQPNARRWRRYLSENAYKNSASMETLYQAERLVSQEH
jgi:tRNA-dihydrouridine synthase A